MEACIRQCYNQRRQADMFSSRHMAIVVASGLEVRVSSAYSMSAEASEEGKRREDPARESHHDILSS